MAPNICESGLLTYNNIYHQNVNLFMLNKIRPQLKILVDPLAKRVKINPNLLTIIGLLLSFISAYLFATGNLLGGGIFIGLSGLMDILDGAVARNHNTQSTFGSILDSTADRFADAAILIGIIYGGYSNWLWGVLALHASLSVSYVRARMEVEGLSGAVGIAERAERLFIIMGGVILTLIFGFNFLEYAVILVFILGYITVLQRLYASYIQLENR